MVPKDLLKEWSLRSPLKKAMFVTFRYALGVNFTVPSNISESTEHVHKLKESSFLKVLYTQFKLTTQNTQKKDLKQRTYTFIKLLHTIKIHHGGPGMEVRHTIEDDKLK